MVQTIVRSSRFPDPVISVLEHRGVRSIGSDHSSIWVWTKTRVMPNVHFLDKIENQLPKNTNKKDTKMI